MLGKFASFRELCWVVVLLGGSLVVGCGGPTARPAYVSAVPAGPQHPVAALDSGTAPGTFHTVQPGQTLWTIAQTYGVELHRVAAANEILDASNLESGSRLWIPGATAPLEVPRTFGADADTGDSLWIWPVVKAAVLSHYGARRNGNRTHRGLDLRGRNGEPVLAARDGKVIYSADGMRGYGKTVILDHGDGFRSLYAHNSKLLVQFGQAVVAGQPIARVGRTGNASGDHLHFEIRKSNRPIDPLPFLNLARKGER